MIVPRPAGAFGPWIADLDESEERAQLRLVGGIAASFIGSRHPLVATLRNAEHAQYVAEPHQAPDHLGVRRRNAGEGKGASSADVTTSPASERAG
jgi:hypothetical protein